MSTPTHWDETRTLSRLGNDQQLIEKLATLFLRDAPQQISQALQGIKEQDYDISHTAIHSLKGTSSSFCTVQLEALCSDLLDALKLRDWQAAEGIHAELARAYHFLEIEFELFLGQ